MASKAHHFSSPGVRKLFGQTSKFQVISIFICLMLLRIGVGYHFYKEGTDKLKSGTFTSKYFLAGAKGPFAHLFTGMLEDPDGSQQLCIKKIENSDGTVDFEIDHSLTELLWNDMLNRATIEYKLGDEALQEELLDKRQKLAEQIDVARRENDRSVDTNKLAGERALLEQKIKQLRTQRKQGEEILKQHVDQLVDWLSYNEVELLGYYRAAERVNGFERDGENKEEAALFVDTLRSQVDSIRSDRQKKMAGWSNEVTALWDSYEQKIQGLAIEEQKPAETLVAHRPFDEKNSFYKVVDRVIPWFDTIIGVSLILGLFTRVSSLAAAGFLFSVIMTQPPWIPGTTPTYFYFIELFALLVIFATHAGRMGGLDYFLNPALYGNPVEGQAAVQDNPTEGQLA